VRLAAAFAFVVVSSLAPVARADGYVWGGTTGRVSVDVQLSGFNEGAGIGGWRPEDARWFRAWAATVEALLPVGVRMEITSAEVDGELVARFIRGGGSVEELPLGIDQAFPGDLDAILPELAAHLGAPLPASPRGARIYTVQLFASASADAADAFAESIDAQLAAADTGTDFFYGTCTPCSTPVAHVLPVDSRGLHTVVVGLHADRGSARRALDVVRTLGLGGFVRAL
jgi:hypothetical protein